MGIAPQCLLVLLVFSAACSISAVSTEMLAQLLLHLQASGCNVNFACCLLLQAPGQLQRPAKSVSPCQTGTRAATALLQAARQQLPLRHGAALKSSDIVRVRSWQQLVDAVQQAEGPTAAGAWKVFELQASTAITATSTLQLKPGMAVVAAGARQAGGSRVSISCQEGVQSAFDAVLAPSTPQG
jgi:hypothetical protein